MSRDASSISSSDRGGRRGLLLGAAGLGLSACGFRPLYAPVDTADGASADLARELAAVRVAPMPERLGQIMQRHLERRLRGSLPPVAPRYDLTATFALAAEVLAYRPDGIITRVRYVASSDWGLLTRNVPPERLASGHARALDAFNVLDFQFFASDSSNLSTQLRLVEEVAEQLYARVATELRGRLERGAAPAAG